MTDKMEGAPPSPVLITGGTGRVGRVIVREMLASGTEVVVAARQERQMAELQQQMDQLALPGRLRTVAADLSIEGATERLLGELDAMGLYPQGLVNNARDVKNLAAGSGRTVTRRSFLSELTLGVVAPYELTMELAGRAGSGLRAVVNIGSIYGMVAPNLHLYAEEALAPPVHYGVTKAALVHLTRELSVRLAPQDVRVNAVSYGGVIGRADESLVSTYSAMCPAGRMLDDADLAGPVRFLLSPSSKGTTGHNLVVDGGWTAW